MGAARSIDETLCCTSGSNVPCCSKGNGYSNEIRRAPATEYGASFQAERPAELPAKSTWFNDGAGGGGGPVKDVGGHQHPKAAPHPTRRHDDDREETYEDGSTYNGQLIDGRRHGRGVWTSSTEQYNGQWKSDQRDGHGSQVWQDGRVYEGDFVDGKFHGHGRMEWHTPEGLMVYDGQYIDDVKHGRGMYNWPDGRIYDGQWENGKRSGEAYYTNLCGEKKRGIWNSDKIERWLDANGFGE